MQTECVFIGIYMCVFTCGCVRTHVCVVCVVCVRCPLKEPRSIVLQYTDGCVVYHPLAVLFAYN